MFSRSKKSANQIIYDIEKRTSAFLKRRGYAFNRVGWDDCSRAYNHSLGSNISDWTFKTKDGEILPFIRSSNFEDKTLTIKAKDIGIVVGNHEFGNNLTTITFQKYLENYGKYTPDVPDDLDLSASKDELITIRYIAVICREDKDGTCELVPTAYNYQTINKKDPKNIIGASFHMGVGSRTDGTNCESVYLVKTRPNGYPENTWFRLTNEHRETEEQKKSVGSVLGTRSTGIGRNRVQCFQIPRVQTKKPQYRGSGKSSYKTFSKDCSLQTRSISRANVSYGSSAGKHEMVNGISYIRDKTQNVTITFAYYYSVEDENISLEDMNNILDTLDNSYKDKKGKWLGSLVTGEGEGKFKDVKPEINLKEIEEEDYLTFNQKVTCFPKDIVDIQMFPQ